MNVKMQPTAAGRDVCNVSGVREESSYSREISAFRRAFYSPMQVFVCLELFFRTLPCLACICGYELPAGRFEGE